MAQWKSVVSWEHQDAASIPGLAQWVQDLTPGPETPYACGWPKKGKKKKVSHSDYNVNDYL